MLAAARAPAARRGRQAAGVRAGRAVVARLERTLVLPVVLRLDRRVAAAGGAAVRAAPVRLVLVAVNVVDFFLSFAIWGSSATVRLAG